MPGTITEWLDARRPLRDEFLQLYGWNNAQIEKVGEDSAFRRYVRLHKNGMKPVILMEAAPDGESMATPGHSLNDFVRIGNWLGATGLHTPHIYAADAGNGYILMEDFGDTSFKKAMDAGYNRRALYEIATDVLIQLRDDDPDIDLPDYYASHVHAGRRRLVDWYMPACTGRRLDDGIRESYLAVWQGIEETLPPPPKGFLHIDFHFENLMLLPPHPLIEGEGGIERCGILDFQGAMRGPLPYDLANLLEDARVDVPLDLRQAMLERYCYWMEEEEKAVFLSWYRIMATQFHCRVIGQFIRLAVRDGKDRYLQHIPRVAQYIREGLKDPLLQPLAQWCREQGMDFSKIDGFDVEAIRPLIRQDAF